MSQTVLLRICDGSKSVCDETGAKVIVTGGEFAFFRQGETLTIGNLVGPTGLFSAEGLVINADLMASYVRHFAPLRARPAQSVRSGKMGSAFKQAFHETVRSLSHWDVPERIITHRIYELLAWLEEAGVFHQISTVKTVAERLRHVLKADLERPWKAPDAARQMGMSEATLRRALNREGTQFSKELREARLSFALMRIQTTDQPLAEIAYQSGYSSQSRLSEAFRTRFHLSPSNMRVRNSQIDRIA